MKIFNLTQHKATPEQLAAGVIDLPEELGIKELLNFESLPTLYEVERRAIEIVGKLAVFVEEQNYAGKDDLYAMIGGAPFLMRPLEDELMLCKIIPIYAFSKRESVEKVDILTGETVKTSVFRHAGFVGL